KPGMVLNLQEYRGRNEEIAYKRTISTTASKLPKAQKADKSNPTPAPQQTVLTQKPEVSQKVAINHTIQPGDTLYALSRKYKVSVDEIRTWNKLDPESILRVGQVIIIKN